MVTDVEHLDVLIIGAGLSGVGAAHHLQEAHPGRSYAILEMRSALGGTWDLFRYPGIRSDSDMHTLGYSFRPWISRKAIADGPSILEYVRDTAQEGGIVEHIRYRHRVTAADWSSDEARWTITAEHDGETVRFTAGFLYACTGYYSYETPYTPDFAGADRFRGRVVHPQFWSDDIDYAGKRVVVIGSGATAMTLVPAMTDKAEHVTMLQRSPTYVASLPAEDPIAIGLRRVLPDKVAYAITRWKNVAIQVGFYQISRRRPALVKKVLRTMLRWELGAGYDVDKHFTPSYNPWDERFCVVPDSDLFRALKKGTASVVTDRIATFTETGIELESGEHLDADVIVTATGLTLQMLGGADVRVDGEAVAAGERLAYRGMLLEGVPNMAFATGYANASFTLKVDLTSAYVCRLLAYMDAHGHAACVPVNDEAGMISDEPLIDLKSGYIERGRHLLPKQGVRAPWRVRQNYALDRLDMARMRMDDGVLRFSPAPVREPVPA
ncbi:MAG: NAD(P)/FAD-dependent oxidoreductase [Solirubrobacteraceae bacterium]